MIIIIVVRHFIIKLSNHIWFWINVVWIHAKFQITPAPLVGVEHINGKYCTGNWAGLTQSIVPTPFSDIPNLIQYFSYNSLTQIHTKLMIHSNDLIRTRHLSKKWFVICIKIWSTWHIIDRIAERYSILLFIHKMSSLIEIEQIKNVFFSFFAYFCFFFCSGQFGLCTDCYCRNKNKKLHRMRSFSTIDNWLWFVRCLSSSAVHYRFNKIILNEIDDICVVNCITSEALARMNFVLLLGICVYATASEHIVLRTTFIQFMCVYTRIPL